ncbi:ATP-dependent DNA ligase [Paenarthrobacter sp. PH39-S1]|uniref:ATP-dependent DNA ligase n=1 Tax=Paenarthrobacter sp. PH39-S1 TaxID=3046204 RepID=UPI0024BB4099|nr:ATP-dependent DNA ligase [Paenarthrobacter sp. PH39-S1]MDJ0355939.1 ATP-dependent DNA ligase [Paenarthrobacter sp. PH39-S1]
MTPSEEPGRDKQTVTVAGRRLTLSNLNKVLYPHSGTTKGDVISYYSAVSALLISAAKDRPATRKRWVHGVGTAEHPGQMFFQKHLDASAPDWVPRGSIEHKDHTNDYPLVNDPATLTWLGQIAALEIHVPQWRFGPDGNALNPDRLVLDLDPGEGMGLPECVQVAHLARAILTDMGMLPVPVTSGSKGIHLYAGLDGTRSSDEISAFAHELARALEADHPDLVVSDMKKSLRRGRVLVDWSQNNAAKTTVAPYSLRGRLEPMVAFPRTWRELASPALAQLDYREVLRRIKKRKDPMAALTGQFGGIGAKAKDSTANDDDGGVDRLVKYRSMRDAGKTPEPVPAARADPAEGRSFVIQEHHASRLHWDFRLERDGVLVSWALPKGVPESTGKNHLAVQTEDHPLEYGTFAGSIPRGQYGAGEVTIWDAGSYEAEKWRDGKEIIATLTGRPEGGLGGVRKYALIHTGGDGRAENTWLIHLMKDQPGAKGAGNGAREEAPAAAKASARDGSGVPSIMPMLATVGSVQDLDADEDWFLEMKWDGVRAIAAVQDGKVTLTSRNGIDMTAVYPELAELSDLVAARDAVLDGEIVALNKAGRPDFGLLQSRMKLTRPADVDRAQKEVPVHFMVFDLLFVDGERLTGADLSARRPRLQSALSPDRDGRIQLSPLLDLTAEQALASSSELGLEGVLAKKATSRYEAGKRSPGWVKIKHERSQEVVVGGWRPGKGQREGMVGSLLLGVPDGGSLNYVGRVGTGFSERELVELTTELARIERRTTPFDDVPRADAADASWVTPKLVGEVAFSEWTGTGRLRHPVWRGWRLDKNAQDVERSPG